MSIHGNPLKMPPTLEKLEALSKEFFLTGSRFFGTDTFSSDIDLFVQYSVPLSIKLQEMGFKLGSKYLTYQNYDMSIVQVLSLRSEFLRIDIQLVRDAEIRRKVQAIIFHYNLLTPNIPKHSRYLIWNTIYKIVTSRDNLMHTIFGDLMPYKGANKDSTPT